MDGNLPLDIVADELDRLRDQLCTCGRVSHTSICAAVRLPLAVRAHAGSLALAAALVGSVRTYLADELAHLRAVPMPADAAEWQEALSNDERRVHALEAVERLLGPAASDE